MLRSSGTGTYADGMAEPEIFPPELRPPLDVVLAQAVTSLPGSGALPGGSWYEPKFDGFRCLIIVGDTVSVWSRQRKDLTRMFPDLAAAARNQVPEGCIIDGEVVIWNNGRLDFDALQQRMVTARTALPALVREMPASFAAFDVLAVAGQDTRRVPLTGRRALLEELARDWAPPLNLSPGTTDPDVAAQWLEDLPATGVEGLVIKGKAQLYDGGTRAWWKLKHYDVVDVVCAAVIGPVSQPQAVVVGLPINGRLRIVGRSTTLPARTGRLLGSQIEPARTGHPWPEEITETTLNRFSKERGRIRLTLIEPVVVEISADVAWSGTSFRHPVRFLRTRPEFDPSDVEVPEHLQGR